MCRCGGNSPVPPSSRAGGAPPAPATPSGHITPNPRRASNLGHLRALNVPGYRLRNRYGGRDRDSEALKFAPGFDSRRAGSDRWSLRGPALRPGTGRPGKGPVRLGFGFGCLGNVIPRPQGAPENPVDRSRPYPRDPGPGDTPRERGKQPRGDSRMRARARRVSSSSWVHDRRIDTISTSRICRNRRIRTESKIPESPESESVQSTIINRTPRDHVPIA